MDDIKLNDIADDLLILNKITIDRLFQLDNCADCIALYIFYYKTAKWQKTNTIKANDTYVKKSLKWGISKIQKTKQTLKENGLIDIVQRRKDGKIEGWYIRVSYIVTQRRIDDVSIKVEESNNTQNQQVENSTCGSEETNALKENIKCLKKEIEMLKNNKNKEGRGDKENSNKEMEMVYQHYLDRFGTTAGRYKLTDKRKAKLRSRLQDCGAEMIIDAIDHARADYFYNGDNDRGWKADLDFIIRSYENVEKLANLTPRQRKLTWQEKKEQEEQAEFNRKFGEPKYVYEPYSSYELLEGTSEPDEPTREPFSEDFIEQMRQRAFGGKRKEQKNGN